ncbi:ComEC/Rec2 family competence protein [Urechidicola sp. KH5]
MRKMLQFIPVQLTLCLIVGILIGFYFTIELQLLWSIIPVLFVVLLFQGYWKSRNPFKSGYYFITVWLLTISIGILILEMRKPENNKNHYAHYITSSNVSILKIRKELKPGRYYKKYMATVSQVDSVEVEGIVLLNIDKEYQDKIVVGSSILIQSEFKPILPPLNPYYFDYRKYLEKKGVYHQLFVNTNSLKVINSEKSSFLSIADQVRSEVQSKWLQYNLPQEQWSIVNALLLGQRQEISPELLEQYTNAGAIHILAISGLHVGILLLILHWLFKPIERFKYGKIFKFVLILVVLWSYAFIAGLSASVVRAVSMFSAVAIGMTLKRITNVYNTLTISMFFLLLIYPYFLFDVGFQLSYLAVYGIVWLQPMLYKLWIPKWKLIDYFWKLLTVSVAAQLGIIPLSLYYFHQFPSLFFISNLAVIPLLFVVLIGGIFISVISLFVELPILVVQLYGEIIGLINAIVGWVAEQEHFLLKNISISVPMVLGLYVLIIALLKFYEQQVYAKLKLLLFVILGFQLLMFLEKEQLQSHKDLVVFHTSKNSLITHRNGSKLQVYHSMPIETLEAQKFWIQYQIGAYTKNKVFDSIPNVLETPKGAMLLVDSVGVYQGSFKPELVYLRNSPRINMNRLIDSLRPSIIIADGSNYTSYIKRWEETCKQKNTPFHYTGRKGAYIFK